MKVKVSKEKLALMCLGEDWIKDWRYKEIPDFIELEAEPVNGVDKIVNDWIELADHPKLPEPFPTENEFSFDDVESDLRLVGRVVNQIIRYLKARE